MKLMAVWVVTSVLATVLLPACAAQRGERRAQQDRLTLCNMTPTAVRVWIDVSNPERADAPSLVLDGPWEVPSDSTITVRLGQYAEYAEHQRRIGGAYRVGSSWWVEIPDGSGPLAGVYQLMGMITGDSAFASLLAGDGTVLQGQGYAPFLQVRARASGLPTAPRGAAAVEPFPSEGIEPPAPRPVVRAAATSGPS